MPKRGAERELTQLNQHDTEEDEIEEGIREAPIAPVAGRVIKGLPKRKGMGSGAPPAPTSSFGQASSTSTTAPGSSSAAPAPSNPFGGFSFTPSAASSTPSTNAFGGKPADSSAPAPASTGSSFGGFGGPTNTTKEAAPAAKSPFAGLSFGAPASSTTGNAPKPASTSFGFGGPASADAPPKTGFGSASSTTPTSTTFSFGGSAAGASKETPAAPTSGGSAFGASASSATTGSSARGTTDAASAPVDDEPAPLADASEDAAENGNADEPKSNGVPLTQETPPDESETAYWTSLRGLNVSVTSFIASLVADDPFIDLTAVLPSLGKQYKDHLAKAAKDAGWKPEADKVTSTASSKPTPAPDAAAAATKAPSVVAPKPPAAPPSVGSFALPKPGTSSAPASGGFTPLATPSAGSSSTPFAFGGFGQQAKKPTEDTPKKPSAEVNKLVSDVLSDTDNDKPPAYTAMPSSFGTPASTTPFFTAPAPAPAPAPGTPSSDARRTGSLFTIAPSGPIRPATPDSKTFTPSKQLEDASPAKLGKFGPGGSQPQLSFGGAKASPSAGTSSGFSFGTSSTTTPSPSKPFAFGLPSKSGDGNSSSTSQFTFTPPANTGSAFSSAAFAPKPSETGTAGSTFKFDVPSTGTTAPGSGFGGGGGSAFGSAFKSGSAFGGGASSQSQPFSVNAPSAATATNEGGEDAAATSAEPAEPSSRDLAVASGEGEEGEETLFEQKARLYKLVNGTWTTAGTGMLKLKKNEKGKRRLLMRSEGGGNVLLNTSVGSNFKPTLNENKTFAFMGTDTDGNVLNFQARVGTQDAARQIVERLKKEVESFQ